MPIDYEDIPWEEHLGNYLGWRPNRERRGDSEFAGVEKMPLRPRDPNEFAGEEGVPPPVRSRDPNEWAGETRALPGAPSAPVNDRDLLGQQFDRWLEEYDPIAEDLRGEAANYADMLHGLAGDYVDTVRGSDALAQMQGYAQEQRGVYDRGGLTAVTLANLERARRDEDQWIRAQREAALQDLSERGMAGGGAEVLAGIGDRASAADRMSMRDLETNAFAQEQAMAALERAYGAEQNLFDIDRDLAGVQLEYDTEGGSEKYSVAQETNRAAADVWNKMIFPEWLKNRQRPYDTAYQQALAANESGVNTISGARKEGQEAVKGVLDTDLNILGQGGQQMTIAGGTPPPPMNTTMPAIPTGNPGQDIGVAAGQGAAGLVNFVGGMLPQGEEKQKEKT